jgi:ribosomal protein S18 acetylase RimI-like enzyme
MDISQLTIRPAILDDLKQIEEIEEMEYAGDDSFIAEEIHEMLFDTTSNSLFAYECYVAHYVDKVVGYMMILKIKQFDYIKNLTRLFVSEDYRRHGVGSQLLSLIEPTKMGDRVLAEVPEEDYALAKFMQQNGYIVRDVVPAEFDEEGELDLEGYFVFANEKREPMALSTRNLWRAS